MTQKKMREDSVPEGPVQQRPEGELEPLAGEAPAAASEATPPASSELLADAQDRYLRLAADFENFRKRVAKERTELWARAQADLVAKLVDGLDDLTRFAAIDPEETDSRTMHQGVDMVERKMWKQLEQAGVERIDQAGVPFDPTVHEAVTTAAAAAPEQDRTVGSILQPGYRLGDLLIRPARVMVRLWADHQPQSS